MIDLSSSTEPSLGIAALVLAEIRPLADRHDVPLMVVGATARDILAAATVGAPPARATRDVDVAVAVASWATFDTMTSCLTPDGHARHRFRVSGVPLDVVPFGGVETHGRMLDWGDGTRMSALGLREAHAKAETVVLPGGLDVLVPTVAGLTVLKLCAWSERRRETRRDAVDIQTILDWQTSGRLLDAAYDDVAVLEAYDFDPELASTHRLGRCMADLLGPKTGSIAQLLDDEAVARLVADMPSTVANQRDRVLALRRGLSDGSPA
jgi:predicted nucleotidyltransferase